MARGQGALVGDSTSNSMVLFGGVRASNYVTDTWTLTNVGNQLSWTQVSVTGTPPPGRGSQAVGYDSARRKLVVHGGANGATPDNTTWTFDIATSTWTTVTTTGPSRSGAAMAFDSNRNVMLLFGGRGPSNVAFNDVWEFNGASWTQVTVGGTSFPLAREAHVAFFDPVAHVAYISGGYNTADANLNGRNDTWALTGLGTGTVRWQQSTGVAYLPGRSAASIAYDVDRRLFVMFGGNTAAASGGGRQVDDTWVFNPMTQTWVAGLNGQVPLTAPAARSYSSLAWSPIHRRVLLFGGYTSLNSTTEDNQTWVYGGP